MANRRTDRSDARSRVRPTHRRASDQPRATKRNAAFAAGGATAVVAGAKGLKRAFSKPERGKRRIAFKPIRKTPSKGAFAKELAKKVKK